MILAERLFWFKCDNGHIAYDLSLIPQIASQIGTIDFLNSTVDYLLDIIGSAQRGIKKFRDTDDNYEQMLLDDLVDLHNRAVDLFNELMERGLN